MKLLAAFAVLVALAGCTAIQPVRQGYIDKELEMSRQETEQQISAELAQSRKILQEQEKAAKFNKAYPSAAPAPIGSGIMAMPAPAMVKKAKCPPDLTWDESTKQCYLRLEVTGGSQRPTAELPQIAPPVKSAKKDSAASPKPVAVDDQLFSAALAFVIPDTANINDALKAQLLINPRKEVEELTQELTKKGTVTGKVIKVSKVIKATLVAPDFEVTKITEEEQILSDSDSTEWLWSLTPKSSGVHDVSLTVTAIITVGDKESKHHIKSFEKTIAIEITPQQVAKNWMYENWKWVISTLIIPLVAFAFKERFKKILTS